MKRFAFVFAALALTGAMAFADDMAPVAKVTGEVNSGVILSSNSSGNYLKNYGIDYGSGNQGATVLANLDLAGSNYGYSISFAYKGTGNDSIDHAYGWVKPMDTVEVYAGASGNNAPFGDLDDNGAGNYSTSALGAFYSMSGFSVGAQLAPQTVVSTAVPLWIGARYAMDKVFTVNAYGTNGASNAVDQVHVTASLLAVTGLTLTGGYNAGGLSVSSSANSFIDATGAYAITDAFSAGVTVYADNLSANPLSNGATQAYYVYKPFVNYKVSDQVALWAYYDGETAPFSGATVDSQILGQLAWMPAAGVTIKFSAWFDTNAATAGTLSSTYVGNAVTGTNASQTNAAIDAKFAF